MEKHLFVISLDALGALDLQDTADLPVLRELIETGTHIQEVETIYPSLTYPAHTSIITGHYPATHGIVNNTKIQPEKDSPDWYWYKKAIQVPTLYDLAKEQGMTTAAFLWPVAAKSGIDYNIAEIFPNRFWLTQMMVSLHASSPLFLIDMDRKFGHLRKGINQPDLDIFLTASVVDTIKTKKPTLLLTHLVDMDSMRHQHGVHSPEAKAALKRHDNRLAEIIKATKDAGIYENTVFAILGDHYQINVTHAIRLNVLFAEKGWVTVVEDKITDWEVYAKSCDGSCYIYTKNDLHTQEIQHLLQNMTEIEEVLTTEEITRRGADNKAAFMVEGKSGYYFMDDLYGPLYEEVTEELLGKPGYYKAVHGYSPNKPDYKTTIIFNGPGIKKKEKITSAHLVDEAPTFAKILRLQFPSTAGTVIEALFE
ncbi:alkaline phosphatase family protein [Listeria swaminathanii]|uniref:Alkaline phosphatase family protein n=1 Tax=Listeria swaminathanii TaxID=2713501 RepID=A0ABU2IBE4_9LIST|nr:alkaline phosphatase family protein [Listeria swaminathanii]MDT0016700.1 alkaline phosphatase family protein [Listeria swaminathanii]MDT0022136.1 alkaline phosphatase family protein [Listeria swaminathanii]MDT0033100.1 alkaline phosphatase family protein [Listeria swaminathanii]MDT0051050.1 alkaline phosphatase family protein [Listeria swaminathanii]MDT0053815.1 alkaline phosphatase family protein [Listeria swaminathanii]